MKTTYGQRDYLFGQTILTLRQAIGLTQQKLAEILGVSRRAIGEWEAGSSYPKADHLKHFIELAVKQQAFSVGNEAQEISDLWKASHQKVLLDEQWLSTLLSPQPPSAQLATPTEIEKNDRDEQIMAPSVVTEQRIDWGDALAVPSFYGREQELETLSKWVIQERCRVVSLLGIGGVGKSALAVNVMYQLAEHFEVVIFRSLRDAPPCETLLEDCLQVFSLQPFDSVAGSLESRISLLLDKLRQYRALVVLDNLETLLEEGNSTGRYRPGFESYGRLLRRVAETTHRSCLLLTSREKLMELRPLEGNRTPVRALRLSGLDAEACEKLLADNEVMGSEQDWTRLVEVYAGNPLALKIVAETITDLFGGEISHFLAESTVIFGSIADLLGEQFARLSQLEQTVLCWLAIVREPMTLDELLKALVAPLPRVQVLEALDGLRRRSLVERGQRQASFTLQSVVLEYVIEELINEASSEIQQGQLDRLIQHELQQAYAKEYVRQAQERLLVAPLLATLQRAYQGRIEVEEQLLELLDQLREQADYAQGYGPANLITLLGLQRGHLQGVDLSSLVIRGANMQGIEMQDASLAGATIRDSIFTEALNIPWSVAISRDGNYWAAGSMKGEVHVWRTGLQTLHLSWQAHTDTIITLTFSPDGRTLATGSWDGSVKLWEVQSGALLWHVRRTKSINCVAFAVDGSMLASGESDGTVQIWDTYSGAMQQTLPHPHPVYAVTWSPDGHLLASGDFGGEIRLWQMQTIEPATCVQTIAGHSNWVTGLAFSPDGHRLASASFDYTVRLWNVQNGHLLHTLSGHTDQVNRVVWSPDGSTLASCGYDHTIWLWDAAQSKYRAALHGHNAAVYSLAFTPDSSRLFSGGEDGTLRVWDMEAEQCIQVLQGYSVSLYDVDWSPDGSHLVSGSTDGQVTIWDLSEQTLPKVLQGHSWIVFGVAWSPNGRQIASCGWDNTIRLWDSTSGACLQVLRDPDDPETIFEGVEWSSDGQRLACGTNKYGVQVWDVIERRRWRGETHQMLVDDVAWNAENTTIASTGDEGSVYLWNAFDGTQIQRFTGHRGRVNGVVWSPEGNRLASCGGEEGRGELFVWDIKSGERAQTFAGHPGVVYAAAWGTNGDLLISGGSDGILRWWNVQNGQCIKEQAAHQGTIQSLRRSPDGRKLASCGDDGAIMIWDLSSTDYQQSLRRDRPYERLNITGIKGLTEAQKATLRALGAIEESILSQDEIYFRPGDRTELS